MEREERMEREEKEVKDIFNEIVEDLLRKEQEKRKKVIKKEEDVEIENINSIENEVLEVSQEVLKEIKKRKEKEEKFKKATELKTTEKLLSNVFLFDLLTGGIPIGKFTMFHGEKSTSKSTFALRICRSFLENYDRKVLYIDFEDTFDIEWAKTIFGKEEFLDNVYVAKPAYLEEGIEIVNDLKEEERFNEIGLIVVDSLASMVPLAEAESEAEQSLVGLLARGLNRFLRKLLVFSIEGMKNGFPVTTILINQVRMGFQSMGGPFRLPQEVKPGGKFQEALVSLDVKFTKGTIHKENDVPILAEYKFKIEKNKTGGFHDITGSFTMVLIDTDKYKRGEIIDIPIVINVIKKLGFLEQEGSKYRFLDEEYKTQKEIAERLREDNEFRKKVVTYICQKVWNEPQLIKDILKKKEK